MKDKPQSPMLLCCLTLRLTCVSTYWFSLRYICLDSESRLIIFTTDSVIRECIGTDLRGKGVPMSSWYCYLALRFIFTL